MTAGERREQLLTVACSLFGERGFEGTSIEEIAARAGVSKPVVYEHFGGKEGLYAVVVDRELTALLASLTSSLRSPGHPRAIVERTALVLLEYIEEHEDGFRVLVRDSPVAEATGPFHSMLGDVAGNVEELLGEQFARRNLDPGTAQIYAQMLVGMIAFTGQWWLEERTPDKRTVAAHLTNLAWNGLRSMERTPVLSEPLHDAGPHQAF
jgi:AcrR family transcriptional regulator